MPKIPVIETQRGLGGSFQVHARPGDFAPLEGMAYAERAGQSISNDILQVAQHQAVIKQQKKQQDDVSWVNSSIEAEKVNMFTWMSDEQNYTKETFGADTLKLAQERMNAIKALAPNPEAAKMFENEFISTTTGFVRSATATGEQTRLNNRVLSFETSVSNVMESYHLAQQTKNMDSGKVLVDGLTSITANIDTTFGKIAPETAKKLKTKAYVDSVYASMDSDPGLAKSLLAKATELDEHQRWTISNQIDQVTKTQSLQHQTTFDIYRDGVIAKAKNGTNQQKIDIGEYKKFYPDHLALRLKTTDDIRIDTFNTINDWLLVNSGKNVMGIRESLKTEKDKIQTSENPAMQDDIYGAISQQAARIVELQEKDPVAWMNQYHPLVKAAYNRYSSKKQDSQYGQVYRDEYYQTVLKVQGPVPQDASVEDKHLYLNLPTHQRHVLGIDEAETYAAEIENGSPTEVISRIANFMANFKDPEVQSQAFNDLVTLPKNGIKQEYQFAFLNRNATWINEYLTTIQGVESISKIAPQEKAKYDEFLDANPTWMNFARTLTRDDMQRLPDLQGFKNGIVSYAQARAFKFNESPKQAIKVATDKLINSELGFSEVNGVPIFAMKQRKNGSYRDSDFFSTLGPRLEVALNFIDPAQVNLNDQFGRPHFPLLAQVDKKRREELLKFDLLENAFFQPAPDGQSVSLYYHKGDQAFQLRDNQNRAFVIDLDDLPNFRHEPYAYEKTKDLPPGNWGRWPVPTGIDGKPVTVIYDKHDKRLNATNWPTFIHRKEVK